MRMRFFRRLGLYLSLWLIEFLHVTRYWLAIVRGDEGSQGVRLIIVDERRVLLVSHWFAPWTWTLPGGGVGKNETAEEAALREASEETGLKVNSIAGEIGTYTGSMGERDKLTVYYSGDFEGSLAMRPNLEIMARSWFDLDNLPEELSPGNRRRIQSYKDGIRGEIAEW